MIDKLKRYFKKNQKGAVIGGIIGGIMAIMAISDSSSFVGQIAFGISGPMCKIAPFLCSTDILLVTSFIILGAVVGSVVDNYR